MTLPRGAFAVNGEITQEWRETLRDKGIRVPRDPVTPEVRRPWLSIWTRAAMAAGLASVPRGAIMDAQGRLTREWLEFIRAL